MKYPDFFDTVKTIELKDALSQLLGAFEEGMISFSYLDVVKSAGHSCPTIAGAFLMAREGLKALYGEELPQRGEIKVSFKEDIKNGTAGVVANAFSLITGATSDWGFKGLNGAHDRRFLMLFNADIPLHVRLQRMDTGKTVDVDYNPSFILPDPRMQPLMQKVLAGVTSTEEKELFGQLWQARVRKILESFDKVILLQ